LSQFDALEATSWFIPVDHGAVSDAVSDYRVCLATSRRSFDRYHVDYTCGIAGKALLLAVSHGSK